MCSPEDPAVCVSSPNSSFYGSERERDEMRLPYMLSSINGSLISPIPITKIGSTGSEKEVISFDRDSKEKDAWSWFSGAKQKRN